MSKQVKIPRFYVDIPSFLTAMGYYPETMDDMGGHKLLNLNASNPFVRTIDNDFLNTNSWFTVAKIGEHAWAEVSYSINFAGFINHNFGGQ